LKCNEKRVQDFFKDYPISYLMLKNYKMFSEETNKTDKTLKNSIQDTNNYQQYNAKI